MRNITPEVHTGAPDDASSTNRCSSTRHSSSSSSSSSSCEGDPAAAAHAEEMGASQRQEAAESAGMGLPAYDTASEVQLMAAQVLQRKQQPRVPAAPSRAAAPVQDPIHLLRSDPDKNLRARKELLLSAAGTSSSSTEGGSARVAAVKEQLAGVQAHLRDALGLRESVSEEICIEHCYQPPLLKRTSHDHLGVSGTDAYSGAHVGKVNRLSSTSAAGTGNVGTKAAALSFAKGAGTGSSSPAAAAAAAAPSGAASRARAAGGSGAAAGVPAATKIFFDTSSEVAEMAARVLKRAQHAAIPQ